MTPRARFFRRRLLGVACAAITLGALCSAGAKAQTLNLASTNDSPIEVYADNGIEWQQDNEVLIAQGNARAVRDGVNIFADVLRAYYRREKGRESNLNRLDGAGNVRIQSQAESVEGDGAVYDMDKAVLVVTGRKVIYRSGADVITADQQMEYYEREEKAVARGNAVATHDGKRLHAQVLEAHFRKTADNKSEIHQIKAYDDVVVVSAQDIVRADRGIYNVKTEIAILVGNVRITRGENQLEGDEAEINMRTGISRLLTNNSRVRGIIVPQRREPAIKGSGATGKGTNPK